MRQYPKAVITQKREKCNFHKDLHVLFIRAKYWNWAKCQIREQLRPLGIGAYVAPASALRVLVTLTDWTTRSDKNIVKCVWVQKCSGQDCVRAIREGVAWPQSLLSDSSRWCDWESNLGLLGGPLELFISDPLSFLYFNFDYILLNNVEVCMPQWDVGIRGHLWKPVCSFHCVGLGLTRRREA